MKKNIKNTLCFVVAFWTVSLAYSQIPANNLHFKKLAVEEGLSNASAQVSLRDSYGRIWVGTRSGLNVYDGFKVTSYRAVDALDHGLTSDYIYALLEVGDSALWIGTAGGLFTYHYQRQSFERLPGNLLAKDWITSFEREESAVWIGTSRGLARYEEQELQIFEHDSLDNSSLSSDFVWRTVATEEAIYVMTEEGLNIQNRTTGTFEHKGNSDRLFFSEFTIFSLDLILSSSGDLWMGEYDFETNTHQIIQFNPETDFFKAHPSYENGLGALFTLVALEEGKEGEIYFGMNGGGMAIWNPETKDFRHLMPDSKHPTSIADRDVWDINLDENNVLWLCTDGSGVNYSHPYFDRFETIKNNPYDPHSLGINDVYAFAEVGNILWVGTNGLGLSHMNLETGLIKNYPINEDTTKSLWDNTVYALELDVNEKIWVGSYAGGLSQFDPITETFKHTYNDLNNSPLLSNFNDVLRRDGDWIWVGSAQGLYKINTITFETVFHERTEKDPYGFGDVIQSITVEDNHLWLGSVRGVFTLDKVTGAIDSTHTPLDTMFIKGMAQVSNGDRWFATTKGLVGLRQGKYSLFNESSGLSNHDLKGLVADSQDRLWLPSANGLNLFDTRTSSNLVFRKRDGLPGDQWNDRSIRRGESGTVYIGGVDGFVIIDPDQIKVHSSTPQVFFKSLTTISKEATATLNLLGKPELKLNYADDYLEIAFFSNEIIAPGKVSYQYRIPKIDPDRWIQLSEPNLTFTDPDVGDLMVEVRASNFDGIFGKPSQLLLHIAPPWWATGYAYAGYFVLFVGLLLGRDRYLRRERRKLENTVKQRTSEIRLQKEKAEEDKDTIEKQAKRLQELDQVKSRFFSNISHEFRTPLTLIKGPVEAILGGKVMGKDALDRNLTLVQRNSKTLTRLIDEILDLNKIETGEIQLYPRPLNLYDTIQELVDNYQFICKENELSWRFTPSPSIHQFISVDSLRLEHVLNNLVSNAAKHAHNRVLLEVSIQENHLKGKVSDDGEGIKAEELPLVFERFYQTSFGAMMPHSSGIGLAYVKEIMNLMKGEISVESTPGEGTTFSFSFPVEVISDQQMIEQDLDTTTSPEKYPHSNNKVLIVEDNPEMRSFINQVIGEEFEVSLAENGLEALQVLKDFQADLIISDVMMPKMDGLELLEKVKANPLWKFVSFVMLTAKKSEDLKIEALSFGLDDYLTKPFNPLELEIRIKNLLGNQYERRQWVNGEKAKEKLSTDEQHPMLSKLQDLILQNIDNSRYGVLDLAEALSISDRQLTRITKEFTGLTPAALIREVRLKKAHTFLLTEEHQTIAEVAYGVGFEKPSHFSKLFFERFGKRPSEFL